MKKRMFSIFLTLCMAFLLLPASALAEDDIQITEEQAYQLVCKYWDFHPGDIADETGFELAIAKSDMKKTKNGGWPYYSFRMRWLVDGDHWSTIDFAGVDAKTGQCFPDYGVTTIASGIKNTLYSQDVSDFKGNLDDSQPVEVFGGELPEGLTLNPKTSIISGTPTVSGRFYVSLYGGDTFCFEIQEPLGKSGFSDIFADNEADDAIAWAHNNGYMNGVSQTKFAPNGAVTRQQMWMILARLSGENPANMSKARDWAIKNGISDGSKPENNLNRQQLIACLYRYSQAKNYPLTGSVSLMDFSDYPMISAYARDALSWAIANDIIAGSKDGMLNPTGTALRAPFAVILQRFYQNIIQKA